MHTKDLLNANVKDTFDVIPPEDMQGNINYFIEQEYPIDTDEFGRVTHCKGGACEFWFIYT